MIPKWIETIKEQHAKTLHRQELPRRCGQCWEIEALEIAWEVLEWAKDHKDRPSIVCSGDRAKEAMDRISTLGEGE